MGCYEFDRHGAFSARRVQQTAKQLTTWTLHKMQSIISKIWNSSLNDRQDASVTLRITPIGNVYHRVLRNQL